MHTFVGAKPTFGTAAGSPPDGKARSDVLSAVGAGRVEDTVNLLGRAARQALLSAAVLAEVDVEDLAEEIGGGLLLESSVKAGLDADWSDPKQKASAMRRLLRTIGALEKYIRDELAEFVDVPPLVEQLATLAKLREQNLDPEPPDGGAPRVREGVAPDRTISLSDPEMRHGRKSKSRTFNGYKSHIATDLDTGVVLACALVAANRPEREGLDGGDRRAPRRPWRATRATLVEQELAAPAGVITVPPAPVRSAIVAPVPPD